MGVGRSHFKETKAFLLTDLRDPSDPHVGVSVCMRAFEKVPEAQRARLAAYMNDTTRLVGGSADTMYIPGRHRARFADTLGLFLETDCFFEIATPTALHLVVPPDEDILFVDHVRAPFLVLLVCGELS